MVYKNEFKQFAISFVNKHSLYRCVKENNYISMKQNA